MELEELVLPVGSSKEEVKSHLNDISISYTEDDDEIETERLDHTYGMECKVVMYIFDSDGNLESCEDIY